jgi:hypothetical protein
VDFAGSSLSQVFEDRHFMEHEIFFRLPPLRGLLREILERFQVVDDV